MTVPKGKPNEPANAEIVTVEEAIRCADGRIHYSTGDFQSYDASTLLAWADKHGATAEPSRRCGPHSYVTRERIVTAWTEKPL